MSTATQIRDSVKVRFKLKTDGTDTKSDTLLLNLLNAAYHDIELDTYSDSPTAWSWLKRTFSFKTTANKMRYPLSAGGNYNVKPGSLKNVRSDVPTKLDPTDSAAIVAVDPDFSDTGDSYYYWLEGNDTGENENALEMWLYPKPSSERTITYEATILLPDVLITETPLIPLAFHPVLTNMLAWYWAEEDGQNPRKSNLYKERALLGLSAMRSANEEEEDRIIVAGSMPNVSPQSFPAIGYGKAVGGDSWQ